MNSKEFQVVYFSFCGEISVDSFADKESAKRYFDYLKISSLNSPNWENGGMKLVITNG